MPISETYNCDCMDYLATIPDKYFDLAICDPPYGLIQAGASSGGAGRADSRSSPCRLDCRIM